MGNEDLLVQFLVAGISGGIIVLLVYLGKKAENVNIKLSKKFGIILIIALIIISLIILLL